jgi:hypothetical protein
MQDRPLMSLDEAREFIADQRWTYAKTMPQWPHEYIIKQHRPEQAQRFADFVRLILSEGVIRPWPENSPRPKYHNAYLVVDGFKYWAMGPGGGQYRGARDDAEDRGCINRAAEPDPESLPSHIAYLARGDERCPPN